MAIDRYFMGMQVRLFRFNALHVHLDPSGQHLVADIPDDGGRQLFERCPALTFDNFQIGPEALRGEDQLIWDEADDDLGGAIVTLRGQLYGKAADEVGAISPGFL